VVLLEIIYGVLARVYLSVKGDVDAAAWWLI
jgi:hypothetical protein